MKNFILIFSLLISFVSNSQTFTFTGPATIINDTDNQFYDIPVSGLGLLEDCDMELVNVCINISHGRDRDLDIWLRDPNGGQYLLTSDNGGNGDDYIVTCFDMDALTDIDAGAANPPFNGSFVPEGNIDNANNGQDPNGTWRLRIRDDASNGGDETINSWSITFGPSPVVCPPAVVEDCNGGTTLCGDASFSGNSSGAGNITDELDASNDGCLAGENESSWYYFEATSAGTLELVIRTMVDYDFAIWGPYTGVLSCPPAVPPLRCSYASGGVDTGLGNGAVDLTEGAGGDNFVAPIVAAAGDKFIMVIDNFSSDGSTFTLDWTLSGGASLNCSPLPVTFSDFEITKTSTSNLISWKTYSESNNSHFLIQKRDMDGSYYTIETIFGQGNSSEVVPYFYEDFRPDNIINYYRIVQVDFDGEETIFTPKSVDNRVSNKAIDKRYNLLGQEVNENFKGIVVVHYVDGTREKLYQHGN